MRIMSKSKTVAARASLAASVLLAAIAVIHAFWALGGDGALHTVSGGEAATASTRESSWQA